MIISFNGICIDQSLFECKDRAHSNAPVFAVPRNGYQPKEQNIPKLIQENPAEISSLEESEKKSLGGLGLKAESNRFGRDQLEMVSLMETRLVRDKLDREKLARKS